MKNLELRLLGVMTGTSCDGLDASCLEVGRDGWNSLWNKSLPYPDSLRKRVLEFQKPASKHSSKDWLELHRDLGNWYGSTLNRLIGSQKIKPEVIANHGQTIAHFPAKKAQGTTLQMGDSTRIVEATGITVVSHFREGDMAAGGQGAPLVPRFHQMIGRQLNGGKPGFAIHNLGGISNLSYFGPDDTTFAFDTGPANVWIDAAVSKVSRGKTRIDRGGKMALAHQPDLGAVKKLMKHPYFSLGIPKSTGRDDFSERYFLTRVKGSNPSLVATATELTVESIVQSYDRWIIRKGLPLHAIYFCGGGAKNRAILQGVKARLKTVEVDTVANHGLDPQYIEAQAFAYLGYLSFLGKPVGGVWTGASKFGPPGQITPGKNWLELLKKLGKSI